MAERPDLIILSGGMWQERWTTYQRVASCFRNDFRILYVEGNYSFGKIARNVTQPGSFPIVPFGRLRTVDEHFHILTPPPRLFLRHFLRPVGILNQAILGRAVRRAAHRLEMRNPILWTFLHQTDRILGSLGERLAVYHCVDHWAWLMPRVPLMGSTARIQEDETRTAVRADFTVSTSKFLRKHLLHANQSSFYVPNAADVEKLSRYALDDPPPPVDMASISRPVLGFAGTLEMKSDLDLLRHIALQRPNWSQVFVGHAENVPDIAKLRGLRNVHFLGLKHHDDLPLYLRHFDVCLVPFRRTPELESISPLKVFEYLAAGRPVVATRYSEIESLIDVVELCEGPDQFITAIERALEHDRPKDRERRLSVARNNSWSQRYEVLRSLIDQALTQSKYA